MAKIILNVQLNANPAFKGIDELREKFTEVANAMGKIKVDENLPKGIKELSNYYTNLANAAKKVVDIATQEEKLNQQREKTAQQRLKTEQEEERTVQQKLKTETQVEKLTRDRLKTEQEVEKTNQQKLKTETQLENVVGARINTEIKAEKLEREHIRTRELLEKQTKKNSQSEQELGERALVVYTNIVKAKEAMVDTYQTALPELDIQFKNAAESNVLLAESMDKAFGYASRYLIRMFIREVKGLFDDLLDTLQKTEDKVIELQRVIRESISNSEVSDKLYKLAQQYGQTFENAAELAGNFARAGYSWSDSLKATESALLAMNVAELNSTQASEGLIAVMTQFKIDASELELVIDKLNKTADENPVTTEKLLKALQRAGSAAVNANISLDKTIGLITTLSKATARSGQNLGTAVNALIMYTQKAKSLEVFASLSDDVAKVVDDFKTGAADIVDIWEAASIELQKLREQKGSLQSALDMFADTEGLEELNSTLHDELEDIFDQTIGLYNVANTYRKNYFIALLDNLDKVAEVEENLADAQGYSQEENLKYMESYTAQVNTLKSKWEELLNDEQGFLAFRKGLLDIGETLIDLIKNTGGLTAHIVQITTLVTGLILLIKSATIGKKVVEIFKALKAGREIIFNLRNAIASAATEEEKATIAAQMWGAALLALTVVITVLNSIDGKIRQAREDLIEAGQASRDTGTELSKLYAELDNLTEGTTKYKEVEEKIVSLLGDKAELLQDLTKGTDEYTEAVKRLTQAELERALADQKAALQALENEITGAGFNPLSGAFTPLPGNYGNMFAQYVRKYYTGNTMAWDNDFNMDAYAEAYANRLSAENLYKAYLALEEEKNQKSAEIRQAEIDGRKEDAEKLQQQYNRMANATAAVADQMLEIGRVLGAISVIEGTLNAPETTGTKNTRKKKVSGIAADIVTDATLRALAGNEEEVVDTGVVDTTDYYLEALKAAVTLRKSELTLMEYQGASTDELIAKHKEIQSALHDQVEYMRSIGADQAEINGLSSEWYSWQEKIESLIKKTYTDEINLIKSRLTLAEHQDKEYTERIALMKEIQNNLHEEAEYLREIGAEEADINALSSEWWTWQEKILKLYQETLDNAKQLELDAIQKIIDSILDEIDLEEEQLTLAEKRLAITKAQKDLEEAIAQAKIDYVSSVLSEYISALSEAETLEEKQKAVTEARTNALNAQKTAQTKAIVEAMQEQRNTQKDSLDLAEKQLAVEEARQRLADAERNLTTRVFNEATGQWEYQANAKDVQSAQEALASAMQSLNDYLEGEAWDEIIEGMEKGSLSESEMLAILQKWANLSPDTAPGFVDTIAEAYRRAIGTPASPDSIQSEIKSVNNAVDNLNDYLKNQAVKELQDYIKAGNTSTEGMQQILDKWLSKGVGSEIYEWRDGLLATVTQAIKSGKYDDTKVQSKVTAVSTAIDNLKDYLNSQFLANIKALLTGGTAAEMYELINKAKAGGEISDKYIAYGEQFAAAKSQQEQVNAFYDALGAIAGGKGTAEDMAVVLAQMKANSADWASADADGKEALAAQNKLAGDILGWDRRNGIWYDQNGNRVYDRGGVLGGMGGIKATRKPEIILDPDLTSKILAPRSEAQFRAFADAMHLMFERGDRLMSPQAVSNYGGNSSVDSHNITVNGVPITSAMAETHTIAELCRVLPLVKS